MDKRNGLYHNCTARVKYVGSCNVRVIKGRKLKGGGARGHVATTEQLRNAGRNVLCRNLKQARKEVT